MKESWEKPVEIPVGIPDRISGIIRERINKEFWENSMKESCEKSLVECRKKNKVSREDTFRKESMKKSQEELLTNFQ